MVNRNASEITCLLVTIAFAGGGCIGFVVGQAIERQSNADLVFKVRRGMIQPVLAQSDDYSRLTIYKNTSGNIALHGQVPSEHALVHLRNDMRDLFGNNLSEEIVRDVIVVGE